MDGNEILMGIVLTIYLLPGIIALQRKHKNANPLFIVNLFFGWTFIGWVGCLAWSLSYQEPRPATAKQPEPANGIGKWIDSPTPNRSTVDTSRLGQ
jgi:hypothetical protein